MIWHMALSQQKSPILDIENLPPMPYLSYMLNTIIYSGYWDLIYSIAHVKWDLKIIVLLNKHFNTLKCVLCSWQVTVWELEGIQGCVTHIMPQKLLFEKFYSLQSENQTLVFQHAVDVQTWKTICICIKIIKELGSKCFFPLCLVKGSFTLKLLLWLDCLPIAEMIFTVFRSSVALRMFWGNSSPLKLMHTKINLLKGTSMDIRLAMAFIHPLLHTYTSTMRTECPHCLCLTRSSR